ncbi:MAG TPA: hypothetical protein VJB99_02170 [Patescibacteria group bacterium]|nr:hypothetical protein [Patescibacteria group bacterium]
MRALEVTAICRRCGGRPRPVYRIVIPSWEDIFILLERDHLGNHFPDFTKIRIRFVELESRRLPGTPNYASPTFASLTLEREARRREAIWRRVLIRAHVLSPEEEG